MKLDWALKLAGLMDDYDAEGRDVPLELRVEFCRALDILEEAAPLDRSAKWPAPTRSTRSRAGLDRLREFEAAYFDERPGHSPEWLQHISGHIIDRRIQEIERSPAPDGSSDRYFFTRDYRLLDSAPMREGKWILEFHRATGQWKDFDGFVYLWRESIPVTAAEAKRYGRAGAIPARVKHCIETDTGLPPDPYDDDDD